MLHSKQSYTQLLYRFLKPFELLYNANSSSIVIPGELDVSYSKETMRIESFSRSLLGWTFLNGHENTKRIIFSMIKNGVNPNHPAYWGEIKDYDQKIVEMFPILLFCIENRQLYQSELSDIDRFNISVWFNQINTVEVPQNNWLFFIILVNSFLCNLSLDYSETKINKAFIKIHSMYKGDGWYSDGESQQCDYYIPFAFHYYSLLFVKYNEKHEQAGILLERSKEFAKSFALFFADNGCAVAYGRSLTYKFAQVAFWSIYSLFVTDLNELAFIKGIINRNIEWWLEQSIFDYNGFLQIGYSYSNQFMTEYYNAKGSSYWSLKSFVLLLNSNKEFFEVEQIPYRVNETNYSIPAIFSNIISHNGQSYLFINGQKSSNEFGNAEAKYEKFLYTTICAPCIARSISGIENLAPDNTLALQIGDNIFVRKNSLIIANRTDVMISEWRVMDNIVIRSYVFPGAPYHYRVHAVNSDKDIRLFDFGTAVYKSNDCKESVKDNRAVCFNKTQYSMIYPVSDNGLACICNCSPNVNLQYTKVVIPYVYFDVKKGNHYVVDFCEVGTTANTDEVNMIEVKNGVINYRGKMVELGYTASKNVNYKSQLIANLKEIKRIIGYFK